MWQKALHTLILERTGLEVHESTVQLEALVNQRTRDLQLRDELGYVQLLRSLPLGELEWAVLLHSVANGLTHFFRDQEQLDVLSRILERMAFSKGRTLKIWSAGCSTGEEPYTLAMICARSGIHAEIHGTDIDPISIAFARRGVYPAWSLRHVSAELRNQFFTSREQNEFIVKTSIASKVTFVEHNLCRDVAYRHDSSSAGQWDVILCRNVLIYYSRPVVIQILSSFASVLDDAGVLVLGASEILGGLNIALRTESIDGRVFYRRSGGRESLLPQVEDPSSPKRKGPEPPARIKRPPQSYIEAQETILDFMSNDDVESVIACLKNVIAANAQDTVALLTLGHAHLLVHRFDQAAEYYGDTEKLAPLLPETHFFEGILERKRHRLEQALEAFRKALFLEPTFWAACFFRGAVARLLGRDSIWIQEWSHAAYLLQSGEGTLPLISHPVFHARHIPRPAEVLTLCEDLKDKGL